MRTFVAPGKLVLVGEYAVLDGAPAVVCAVDRGVRCEATPGSERVIHAPDDRYVLAALEALGATGSYRFSDWNPPKTDTKAGLGGSAAAVVAALLAGLTLAGEAFDPAELTDLGTRVHRTVQGSGSGVDVAASAHGGILRFVEGQVEPIEAPTPVVVFSGRSASTGPRVEQYLGWANRNDFVERSTEIANGFADDPIEATREARALLRRMTEAAGILWATDALDHIAGIAEEHGGAAKPSGAGGGDCAVAFVPDPTAFIEACEAAGFTVIPTRVSEGAHET